MTLGLGLWWMFPVFVIGMMVLVGRVVLPRAFRGYRATTSNAPLPDPLVVARERYAQGLLSKFEFDQIVQDLLFTEDSVGTPDGSGEVPGYRHPRDRRDAGLVVDKNYRTREYGFRRSDDRCRSRAQPPCR